MSILKAQGTMVHFWVSCPGEHFICWWFI